MHRSTLPLALLAGVALAAPADPRWGAWPQSSEQSTATATTTAVIDSTPGWGPSLTSAEKKTTRTTGVKTGPVWEAWPTSAHQNNSHSTSIASSFVDDHSTNAVDTTIVTTRVVETATVTVWRESNPSANAGGSQHEWQECSGEPVGAGGNSGLPNSGSASSGSNGGSGSSSTPGGSSYGTGNSIGSWSGTGTPSSFGPLDEWFRQPVAPDPAVPTATLLPTTHWTHDASSTQHIEPSDNRQQYYVPEGASSDTAHQYGWLTTNFTNNAIILDHSELYTWFYTRSSGSLTITFKDKATFNLAQSTWHTGMIAAYYDGTCGEAMNCYVIFKTLSFNAASGTCTVSTSAATFEDIASYFVFEWGQYVPGRRGGRGSGKPHQSGGSTSPTSTTSSGSSVTSTTASTIGTSTGTATPGNYSLGYDGDNDNCTAPVDTVYGLPTACLGQYFDADLDDSYAYQTLKESDFSTFAYQFNNLWYDDFASGSMDAEDYSDDDASLGLSKRWGLSDLNPLNLGRKVIKAVAQKLPPIPGITRPYDIPLINKAIPLNLPSQRKTVQSPWGQQVLIKSLAKQSSSGALSGKIDLYCVDCGASGSANIAGKIGVSLAGGVDYVKADLDMNLAIGLKLGLVADVEYKKSINEPLFIVPLSPLTIGVASIGPILKAGVEIDLNLAAKGQILGGGSLSFSNAKVSLDVTSFSGSASGWTPSFDPVFEAQGEISASADFGVPIAIGLGISALKWSADVSLVERPGIVAKAQAKATANLAGAGFVSVDGCTGISAGLSFKNDVYAQFTLPGATPKKYGLFTLPEKSLYNHCIALPAAPPSTQPSDSDDSGNTGSSGGTDTSGDPSSSGTTDTSGNPDDSANPGSSGTTDNSDQTSSSGSTDNSGSPDDSDSSNGSSAKAKRLAFPQLERRQANTTSTGSTDADGYSDTTSTTLATAVTNTTAYVVPDSNDLDYNRTDGYYMSTLVDTTARFQAYPCSNGNVHIFGVNETNILASDCQEDFTLYRDDDVGTVAVADGFSRVFIYYPDEMNKTGVSRIRVVDTENIPIGSEEIVWVLDETAAEDDITVPIYYPIDQNWNTFYPAMCRYTAASGIPNKMFLMKDSEKGLTTLSSATIKFSITGGDIDTCWYLPLIDGSGFDDAGNNGGLFVADSDDEESASATNTTVGAISNTVNGTATSSTP